MEILKSQQKTDTASIVHLVIPSFRGGIIFLEKNVTILSIFMLIPFLNDVIHNVVVANESDSHHHDECISF